MGEKENLQEKRVKSKYKIWEEKRLALDKFIEVNKDFHLELEQLVLECNIAASKLEDACRETGISIGPIAVVERTQPVYDGRFLYTALKDFPSIRDNVVEVQYKVNRSAFESYLAEGAITRAQARKAVVETKVTRALNGIPSKLNVG